MATTVSKTKLKKAQQVVKQAEAEKARDLRSKNKEKLRDLKAKKKELTARLAKMTKGQFKEQTEYAKDVEAMKAQVEEMQGRLSDAKKALSDLVAKNKADPKRLKLSQQIKDIDGQIDSLTQPAKPKAAAAPATKSSKAKE